MPEEAQRPPAPDPAVLAVLTGALLAPGVLTVFFFWRPLFLSLGVVKLVLLSGSLMFLPLLSNCVIGLWVFERLGVARDERRGAAVLLASLLAALVVLPPVLLGYYQHLSGPRIFALALAIQAGLSLAILVAAWAYALARGPRGSGT